MANALGRLGQKWYALKAIFQTFLLRIADIIVLFTAHRYQLLYAENGKNCRCENILNWVQN